MQKWRWGGLREARLVLAVACAVLAGACGGAPLAVRDFTPPVRGMSTVLQHAGTINGQGGVCEPETPPPPTPPSPPAPGEVLVGYQDWRNTVTHGGAMCPSSNAKRWVGVVVFDMTDVAADLRASPHKTLTGTLTYKVGNFLKSPPTPQAIDLCVRTLQYARGYETPPQNGGVVDSGKGGFPWSTTSSLGPLILPDSVPLHQVTASGAVSVDPSAPAPTVQVDVTTLLSDWGGMVATEPANSAEPGRFGIALRPFGPTLKEMGIVDDPPTPVDPSRATAQCTSILNNMALKVHVGR